MHLEYCSPFRTGIVFKTPCKFLEFWRFFNVGGFLGDLLNLGLFLCHSFNYISFNSNEWNGKIIMNGELVGIWNQRVMVYFEVAPVIILATE
jgi:hypothetical protein